MIVPCIVDANTIYWKCILSQKLGVGPPAIKIAGKSKDLNIDDINFCDKFNSFL